MPEKIALTINDLYQQLAQPVPRRHDLKHWLLGYNSTATVERDPSIRHDSYVDSPRSTFVQGLEQFKVTGEDANTATYEFDRRAFVDINLPADAAEKGSSEQASN
jgi:hypothetical protein